jgi:hypothetical protein
LRKRDTDREVRIYLRSAGPTRTEVYVWTLGQTNVVLGYGYSGVMTKVRFGKKKKKSPKRVMFWSSKSWKIAEASPSHSRPTSKLVRIEIWAHFDIFKESCPVNEG